VNARRFSKRVKRVLAIIQGVNADEMEIDHIIPHSKGGQTDISNAQLLSKNANRAKGSNMIVLRDWQEDFFNNWRRYKLDNFLLVVIPGGGKTIAALYAAHHFLMAGSDRAVVVVVPTVNVREQWANEAKRCFGIEMQTFNFGTTDLKSSFRGAVISYQSLKSNSLFLRVLLARRESMVIFDEVHHLSPSDNGWGNDAQQAFENAKKILLLSGTPFRTTGEPIPYISYDTDGFCIPAFRYDYPTALTDGVVRKLRFWWERGNAVVEINSEIRNWSVDETISEEDASRRLTALLEDGEYVKILIRKAHLKLMEIRKTIPTAGAMAVCKDHGHALKMAELIRSETGKNPDIIISDNKTANSSVDHFRNSSTEWLVSVQMVSEGTDIKRLQVLCYLTNAVTTLFFRQLIGRVSRVSYLKDDTKPENVKEMDRQAFVFLPADPRLIRFAEEIVKAQDQAIREKEKRDKQDREKGSGSDYNVLETEHEGTAFIQVGDERYDPETHQIMETIMSEYGVSIESAAQLLKKNPNIKVDSIKEEPPCDRNADAEETPRLEILLKNKACEAQNLVQAIARIHGIDYADVHKCFNYVPGPNGKTVYVTHKDMTLEQLDFKIAELKKCKKSGVYPGE